MHFGANFHKNSRQSHSLRNVTLLTYNVDCTASHSLMSTLHIFDFAVFSVMLCRMTDQPSKTPKRRNTTPRLTFYCPEMLQQDLKQASEDLGITVSELLRVIVEDYLDEKFDSSQISHRNYSNNPNELIKLFGERVLLYAYRDLRRIRSAVSSIEFDEDLKEGGLDWGKAKYTGEVSPLVNRMIDDEFVKAQTEEYLEKNAEIWKLEQEIKRLTLMRDDLYPQIISGKQGKRKSK